MVAKRDGALPDRIWLDGERIDPLLRDATPVDVRWLGKWSFRVLRSWPIVLHVWEHDDFGEVRWQLFHAEEDPDVAPVSLTWSGSDRPHRLGPQEGYGWFDDRFLPIIARVDETSIDAHLDEQVRTDYGIDIDFTGSSGSSNMEFHLPEGLVLAKEGLSVAGYRWLNAYLHKQLLRPRWRFDGVAPAGVDGRPVDAIDGFNEMRTNAHKRNAYDLGHLDASELYWGWMLTSDPAFLYALLNLWLHARWCSVYVLHPDKVTSARQTGWWLLLCDLVLRSIAGIPELNHLRRGVFESAVDHARSSHARFPMIDWYAKPHVFDKRGERIHYGHTWHYAPVLFACDRLVQTLVRKSERGGRDEIQDHAIELYDWFNDELFDRTRESPIAVKWGREGRYREWWGPPGVALWPVAPLAMRDDPGPMGRHLIDWIEQSGATRKSDRYYLGHGVGMIPRHLGFETDARRRR